MSTGEPKKALKLKAREWVEVRSREEILGTLDERGRFENVPFMPEMLEYCGERMQVASSAHKTCDPAHNPWTIRRVTNAVHLEGARCDGEGHGGCQAGCLIFWKRFRFVRELDPGSQGGEAKQRSVHGGKYSGSQPEDRW
jgi:hypothetical protein